ncbi:MAG TPA: CPBP family intramembrane glutamic endopeptidase [Ohtaekwangia sp.]|uniref:CPBP family intramembrane glutamic endopeptidase n=1 Tax=Ohtaekwangia sp. TaxID=2066019 RepID=UPI002F92DD2A
MDLLQWRFTFILISITGWTVYVVYRNSQDKGILHYWGFRTDNFKETTMRILPFGIISVIAFFIIGYIQSSINLTWHIIPILILYPVWGTIQQFLVIALVAGNLHDLNSRRFPKVTIILVTALLFGFMHYPYYWLVLATVILALLYGYIYLRSRNVYVLGLFHGWLGGLFFYTVVGRDPFIEIFEKLADS